MNRNDLADATARALDLLPPGDAARSDPRFARDARLVEEARLTREAAAEVWLAVSPLRVAPPDVLQAVMAEIAPPVSAERGKYQRGLPWLAAGGWAAAALVAICLWPRSPEERTVIPGKSPGKSPVAEIISADPRQEIVPASRDGKLRKEILRLQDRLEALRDRRVADGPRVISLTSPGAVKRGPEETRQRVREILSDALRLALEAESGAPSDPASLVIERGWLPGGLAVPEDGGVARHRNFPEDSWQELGLLRSEEGEYYDPASRIIWSADPVGRGFLGQKAPADEDLARFEADEGKEAVPKTVPRTVPEGFVIENPEEKTAEVMIDAVPPLADGYERFIVWTDLTGAYQTMSASFSGTSIYTLPNVFNLVSFQLVETPLIPNGEPPRIIVEGGP